MENKILSLIDKNNLNSKQKDIIKELINQITFKNKFIINNDRLFLKSDNNFNLITEGDIDKDLEDLSLSCSEEDINMINVANDIESSSENNTSVSNSISDTIDKLKNRIILF